MKIQYDIKKYVQNIAKNDFLCYNNNNIKTILYMWEE